MGCPTVRRTGSGADHDRFSSKRWVRTRLPHRVIVSENSPTFQDHALARRPGLPEALNLVPGRRARSTTRAGEGGRGGREVERFGERWTVKARDLVPGEAARSIQMREQAGMEGVSG